MISIQTGRTFATCLSSLPAAFQTTEKNSHGQKHIGRPGENTKENGLFSTPAENTASSWSETERRFAESGIAGEHITRNDAGCAAGCSKVKYCVEHTYNARVCCYIEQVIAKDSIISYTSGHCCTYDSCVISQSHYQGVLMAINVTRTPTVKFARCSLGDYMRVFCACSQKDVK